LWSEIESPRCDVGPRALVVIERLVVPAPILGVPDTGFDGKTGIGVVDLRVTGTYLSDYDYLPFAGGETVKLAGLFGGDPFYGSPATFAEWQTNWSATLTRDDWGANLTARYMSETDDIEAAPANLENTADNITYFDIQGYYNWNELSFTLGLRNVTDEEPPYVTAYDDMNTLNFSYDTQGRYIYGRLTYSF